ncbi:hypothetical protein J2X29_000156 [Shewanella putrefaciens]|nr:hypothetical protein [Shewanella putrefaciens]
MKLSKYADKNAVATSWMMAQARGDMDVPSEPLGNFYWSIRPVTNACNFARGVLVNPRRIGRAVLLGRLFIKNQGVKPHDVDLDFDF